MNYSQKWSIVCFIETVIEGDEFTMQNWPLHTTLADVFAVDMNQQVLDDIQKIFTEFKGIETNAIGERTFGDAEHLVNVVLLENTSMLQTCHDTFIDMLTKHGAVFNNPEFTHEGFIPHTKIQNERRLQIGDTVKLENLAIIDMFTNSDWQQRKILKLYT